MKAKFPEFRHPSSPALVSQPGSAWAQTMVLNPAIIQDPGSRRLHMLFRATGPCPQKKLPDRAMPYPISLGYAYSDDLGESWQADFSRPVLSPPVQYEEEKIYIKNIFNEEVVDYSNGCIEDPRLFRLDGELYMTVACRMFPVGAYWEGNLDDPFSRPDWAIKGQTVLGRAAKDDVTVNVLYRVDLSLLTAGDYTHALKYVTHITDPERGENRDAFFFPEKLTIHGKSRYVLIHRPTECDQYSGGIPGMPPSIFIACGDDLQEFSTQRAEHCLLAKPLFSWEKNRIGGSFPPIKISQNEWLLGYHGKQDELVGYTQSFMILRQEEDKFPVVVHRCPDRLMYAKKPWEFSELFKTPCVFSCGGIVVDDTLIIGYGAGDERVGIAKVFLSELIPWIRQYDELGNRL